MSSRHNAVAWAKRPVCTALSISVSAVSAWFQSSAVTGAGTPYGSAGSVR